ncbi:MAG: PilZ domain-containing protein [Burkholderiaceae bacterium]|jgi:hypothetical protein
MRPRQFIRHPVNIPIEAIPLLAAGPEPLLIAYSLSAGGLAFRAAGPADPGTLVHLKIDYRVLQFESDARVVWCHSSGDGTELGVEFLNSDDAFQARMVEQICHIESYRQETLEFEGRALSSEEAALEWIARFAGTFPDIV